MTAPVKNNFWAGRRVLLTGHTGFKGAWLAQWLLRLGAHVTAVALPPDTTPSLFQQLSLDKRLDHRTGDITEAGLVTALAGELRPDILFHLAAQSLVLRGYREPVATWSANVMGTVHVLDALRAIDQRCACVIVTTDKVYRNNEWEYGYRESDPLGGHDPYSASKAAAEIAVDGWRKSYFRGETGIRIASARAGNVIGGGDWCENRIVHDLVRALSEGRDIAVRNPHAVRPWQHVLEPLSGYLTLAEKLLTSDGGGLQEAFNFGPAPEGERSVRELVGECLRHWPGSWRDVSTGNAPHEAGRLALNIDKARFKLGWVPRWTFERTVAETMTWYRASIGATPSQIETLTNATIDAYEADAGIA